MRKYWWGFFVGAFSHEFLTPEGMVGFWVEWFLNICIAATCFILGYLAFVRRDA